MEAMSTTAWDDKGAVTSTTSPNVTTMSKRKKQGTGADRMGSYELDGYRMTLTYDDGRVEHHATFTDEDQKHIWFQGSSLYRRVAKKKK